MGGGRRQEVAGVETVESLDTGAESTHVGDTGRTCVCDLTAHHTVNAVHFINPEILRINGYKNISKI